MMSKLNFFHKKSFIIQWDFLFPQITKGSLRSFLVFMNKFPFHADFHKRILFVEEVNPHFNETHGNYSKWKSKDFPYPQKSMRLKKFQRWVFRSDSYKCQHYVSNYNLLVVHDPILVTVPLLWLEVVSLCSANRILPSIMSTAIRQVVWKIFVR